MGTTINGVYEGGKRARRTRALKRLETALQRQAKQPKGTFMMMDRVPLSPEDVTRINKEISILKSKL